MLHAARLLWLELFLLSETRKVATPDIDKGKHVSAIGTCFSRLSETPTLFSDDIDGKKRSWLVAH